MVKLAITLKKFMTQIVRKKTGQKHPHFFVWILLTLDVLPCFSQNLTLNGQISDKKHTPIFAANIFLKQYMKVVTASDLNGQFQLKIPEEALHDTIAISFVGYHTRYLPIEEFDFQKTAQIILIENNLLLDAAIIENNPHISEEFSIEKLNKLDIYLSPVSSGDPLNAIGLLAASTNMSENANPEFRGSHSNASQVILNGIPIANPVRNTQINGMGNFSLFNTELIEDMTVYAGNPPLTYGNSIAGIAEISTCKKLDENQTQVAASMTNVGLLRSQKLGEKGFLQIYSNYQFSQPYLYLNNLSDFLQSFRTNDVGMNFHAEWKHFSVNTYSYFIDEEFTGSEFSLGKKVESIAERKRSFHVVNLRYQANKWIMEWNMGNNYSDGRFDYGKTEAHVIERQYLGNLHMKYFLNDDIFLQAGIAGDDLLLDYDRKKPRYYYAVGDSVEITHIDSAIHNSIPEAFLYARMRLGNHFIVGLGARKNLSNKTLPSYFSWQANVRYNFLEHHSLLLAGGNYHGYYYPIIQYPRFSLQASKQLSLEYCYTNGHTILKAAAYKKQEQGVSYFAYMESVENTQTDISGIEFSAQHEWDHLKISAAYTYLDSKIKRSDSLYHSINSVPYFLKGVVSYTNDHHFTIACSATMRPGLYYTPITGGEFDPNVQSFRPLFGEYNSLRYQDYRRFDLSLNKVIFNRGNMLVLFATLTNIFNKNNESGFLYSYDYSEIYGSYYMQSYSIYFGAQVTF